MPTTDDFRFVLSGGGENTDPSLSLGGPKSSTALTNLTTVFPLEYTPQSGTLLGGVTSVKLQEGSTDYRCLYVGNGSGSDPFNSLSLYLASDPTPGITISLGLDPAGRGNGINTGLAQSIAAETVEPDDVSFFEPTEETPVVLPQLEPGEWCALWVRRVVDPETVGNGGVAPLTIGFVFT